MGKIVAGVSLLVISFGIASADEYIGQITKVDGKKISTKVMKFDKDFFKNFKKDKSEKSEEKGEKGEEKGDKGKEKGGKFKLEEKTFTVTSDCKIVKAGKWDKETKKRGESTAIEDGLKNKLFTDATADEPLKGVRLTTNEKGEVTEITIGGGRGGFGGGKGGFKKKKNNDTSAD